MSQLRMAADAPVKLWQVLEEEFVALHGRLSLSTEYLERKSSLQDLAKVRRRSARQDRLQEQRENKELLPLLYGCIHRLPERRTALCLSGGGIRSATFGLGVLQGLARHDLLSRFDYLSTVSGGGYAGSWLSAWVHHHPDGLRGVVGELTARCGGPLDPEPPQIKRLREYSNYLAPRTGLLSVDTWVLPTILDVLPIGPPQPGARSGVRVQGAGFATDVKVHLQLENGERVIGTVVRHSDHELHVSFPGALPRSAELIVTNPGGRSGGKSHASRFSP